MHIYVYIVKKEIRIGFQNIPKQDTFFVSAVVITQVTMGFATDIGKTVVSKEF